MRLRLSEIARISGGHLVDRGHEAIEVTGVGTDSRTISNGDLFVALRGEFVDGHRFAGEAMRSGAAAAMVTDPGGVRGPAVIVEDQVVALRKLAEWVRDTVDPIVVGITGSTGKTGTKDMLGSIATRKYSTVASKRSYNNEIGVPLTLLRITQSTEVVVCEMGTRGKGQIADLCDYARPQVGVVTNVGVTHFEQFGSKDAIAEGKAELVGALPEGGTAVLNADDPAVAAMASGTNANVITYGRSSEAWTRAERVETDGRGRPTFRISTQGDAAWVTLPVAGVHQVMNALAASAAASALGISLDECRLGLETLRPSPWRMEIKEMGGVVVVNDAYNANPASMQAALRTSASIVAEGGRLLAVLGPMAELGPISEEEHYRLGRLAADVVSRLVVVGEAAAPIAAAASGEGLDDVLSVPNSSSALDALGDIRSGDVILIKGSRVAGLERVAAELLERLSSK